MKTASVTELEKHVARLCKCLKEAVEFAQKTSAGTGHNAGMWATAVAEAGEMLQKESAENTLKI